MNISVEIESWKQELLTKGWPVEFMNSISVSKVHEWDRQGYLPENMIFCQFCQEHHNSIRQEIEGEYYYECQNCQHLNEHFLLENSSNK